MDCDYYIKTNIVFYLKRNPSDSFNIELSREPHFDTHPQYDSDGTLIYDGRPDEQTYILFSNGEWADNSGSPNYYKNLLKNALDDKVTFFNYNTEDFEKVFVESDEEKSTSELLDMVCKIEKFTYWTTSFN